MLKLSFNSMSNDEGRREELFAGTICLHSSTVASRELCLFARSVVHDGFGARDPEKAQEQLQVADFVAIVGPIKSRFTNAPQTKDLVRAYLIEQGVDPDKTYFDVPRLRVVPHSGYLSAGVSYAYKAHRDTWYSSPLAQVNWWLPVWDVTVQRTMAFYPSYWDRPLDNTSSDFDYSEWVRVGRVQAESQVEQDTRKHPLPTEPLSDANEFRYGARAGDAIVFSAAHLHATVPNTSGSTRYSMDFRTVHVDDLRSGRGAPNLDSRASGSTLSDFLRVSDFHPLVH